MAREIESVSQRINGTTAAVVGMRAAVIQAEQEAADHVCANVNRGFYTLIQSQISQKVARLKSEVDSQLMKLNQQRKQLLSVRSRMERDYGMICARYMKLFGGLNQNLQLRVFELDKPTIDFAVKDVGTLSNRTKNLTATVPVAQLESLSMSQRIIASNMKYRGMRAIDSMNRFLSGMKEQDRITHRMLLPLRTEKDADTVMVPVIVCESNYDRFDNKRVDIEVNRSCLSPRNQEAIRRTVAASELAWRPAAPIGDEIRSEFNRCVSESDAPERVKAMAERLFMANNFQTLNS